MYVTPALSNVIGVNPPLEPLVTVTSTVAVAPEAVCVTVIVDVPVATACTSPAALTVAAAVFEERTETSIKVVTTLVPPVLVVLAALVIGFVMAGVLLALLEMQKAIG